MKQYTKYKKGVVLLSAKEQSDANTLTLYSLANPAFAPDPLTVITGANVFDLFLVVFD